MSVFQECKGLGLHARCSGPPRTWTPEARSLALALARRTAQGINSARLWQTAQRELARRTAILKISRAFAEGEPGGDRVMEVLLNEAVTLLSGDYGGISLWDAPSEMLVQMYSTTGRSNGLRISLAGSLSGKAALARRPAISNDYQAEYGQVTPGGQLGARLQQLARFHVRETPVGPALDLDRSAGPS